LNLTANCDALVPDYTTLATATDGCAGTVTIVQLSPAIGSTVSAVGSFTVTLRATDANSNTSTCSFTVNKVDIIPPVITCPATQTLNLTANCNALVPDYTTLATATDGCAGTVTKVQLSPAVGSTVSAVGSFTVTLRATDANSNTSTCSFTVNKVDITPPVITCPATQTLNLTANCDALVPDYTTLATATDGCAGTVTKVQLSPAIGSTVSAVGSFTVTLRATDANSNTSTCSFTVNKVDITPPTVSAGSNQTANTSDDDLGDCDVDVAVGAATFGDNCGGVTLSWVMTGATTDAGAGQIGTHNFYKGVTTIKYTSTDAVGLTATSSKTVTVTDNENPSITCPANITNAKTSNDGTGNCTTTVALGSPVTSDNCSVASVVACVGTTVINPVTYAFGIGTTTVKWKVTDGSGNTATCNQSVTVADDEKPIFTLCPGNASKVFDFAETNYTVQGTEFNATATDNCTLQTLTYITSGATPGLTGTSLAGVDLNLGVTTILWTATDATGNTNTCQFTVTVGKRLTTLTYTGDYSEQYSDQQTLTAYLKDNITNAGLSGKTIEFTIGSQSISAITNASGVATVNLKLYQPPTSVLASISYTVSAYFAGDATYLPSSSASSAFTITKEDADVDYTGQTFVNSPMATTNVLLTAAIKDFVDGYPGNISKAKVKFVVRDYSSLAIMTQSGWLNVSLPNPADTTNGLGVFEWTNAPVPGTVGEQDQYNVEVFVDCDGNGVGNYKGYDISTLSIFRTATIDFITGGGYIRPANSLGTHKADNGRKMNFGFNIKFNKSFKSLQGKLNVIYRVGTKVYQVKTNATSSLTIGGTPCSKTAVFTAKANLTDVTNPLAPIAVLSGLNLQLKLTDNGEPGNTDKWALSLYNGSTLVLASEWTSGQLQELVLGGGNIVVHSGTDCSNNNTSIDNSITRNAQMEVSPLEITKFNVKVFPNPSSDQFSLYLEGANNDKVHIVVYDALGREVKKFEKEGGNIPVIFGRDLKGGAYFVEVRQGGNHKTIKLIKQN